MSKDKRILMILAHRDFRDEEYKEPRAIFKEHGFNIVVASLHHGEAVGMAGSRVHVDSTLEEVNPLDFEAIVFIGGMGAAEFLHDSQALFIAKEAFNHGRVIAAICIAPAILANAGILQGKRATATLSEENRLREKGAEFTGKLVEVDDNIITASGPEAGLEFGQKIVEAIGE